MSDNTISFVVYGQRVEFIKKRLLEIKTNPKKEYKYINKMTLSSDLNTNSMSVMPKIKHKGRIVFLYILAAYGG